MQHLEELSEYTRFGLWWIFLGVASSIGLGKNMFYSFQGILYQFLISGLSYCRNVLMNTTNILLFSLLFMIPGSGLHTFVLYLGPHIALFTIKAMQCGRVDLKSAIYDTIQLKRSPSWLDKPCHEFGSPVFSSGVPLSSILPQVQIEAILWGLGTALGELPPYFISRAGENSLCPPFYWQLNVCGLLLTYLLWGPFSEASWCLSYI